MNLQKDLSEPPKKLSFEEFQNNKNALSGPISKVLKFAKVFSFVWNLIKEIFIIYLLYKRLLFPPSSKVYRSGSTSSTYHPIHSFYRYVYHVDGPVFHIQQITI
jgi:hypothetical protein